MKAPFPWFGGKSRVSDIVWDRFGSVVNYVEPFFGSGAVLLGRKNPQGTETINDADCLLSNFWRSLQHDPEAVSYHADWPVNEADQHARHLWICSQEDFRERMKTEPDYYDAKIAGWWVWGQCIWIGSGWCSVKLPHLGNPGKGVNRQLPHLGNPGTGVHRKLPHLGNSGKGVHRKLPHLGNSGKGVHRKLPHLGDPGKCEEELTLIETTRSGALLSYMRQLSERLRKVRVCCGDWSRVCGPSVTHRFGLTGVFLDPPYDEDEHSISYAAHSNISKEVREWAIDNGVIKDIRIALCGYDGEHEMPSDWECIAWKTAGGYGSQGNGRGRENSYRERIWFSPYCLKTNQPSISFGADYLVCD